MKKQMMISPTPSHRCRRIFHFLYLCLKNKEQGQLPQEMRTLSGPRIDIQPHAGSAFKHFNTKQ